MCALWERCGRDAMHAMCASMGFDLGTANSAGRSTHQQQLRWTVIEVEIHGIQNASLIVGSARVFGKVKTRRLLAQRT